MPTLQQVLHSVERRESRLSEVKRALHSFHWHRGYDTDAEGLITSLAGLRDASRAVIKAIVVRQIIARPILWLLSLQLWLAFSMHHHLVSSCLTGVHGSLNVL